ncbi:MAG: AAA family ATPase [Deltaproteobacteria bacterium]|nr:AAA family ATPase [Deltaproteobacteria bacterium]
MTVADDSIARFYFRHLSGEYQDGTVYGADCPFCAEHGFTPGRMVVFLNRESFFYGYFRCLNRCVPGGFVNWFACLSGISREEVPGYIPAQDVITTQPEYPVENINDEIRLYGDRLTSSLIEGFTAGGVTEATLKELEIGFNGRYIVYPYRQEDGNCYAARCVYPDRPEDYFWHGDEKFSVEPYNLFNLQDIRRCEGGTLFLCEGEENMLPLRQLGFPGVAVSHYTALDKLSPELFGELKNVFLVINNIPESEQAAKNFASRLGFKARILYWPAGSAPGYSLSRLALDSGREFGREVSVMVKQSRAFSPFASPEREYGLFLQNLEKEQGEEYLRLSSGFTLLDRTLGGIHGINVIGGAPKIGKSTFMIQIATEMALNRVPVLYYDFENGRQKIYQRTLSRLSRLSTAEIKEERESGEIKERYDSACGILQQLFRFLRVINDRKVTPALMRKHIEFIRHETGSEYTVVVIDSLHKLPFKEFSERRSGIDAWLRQFESIRDELQVSFLVISELTRGPAGSYDEEPHLGIFKGSGDIEYSADNALVLVPSPGSEINEATQVRSNRLWLVASREHSPGSVADYPVDYPFWGVKEQSI